jgi:hypothetical protein
VQRGDACLRLAPRISSRPPHDAVTCFYQLIDTRHETQGPNERKRSNVRVGKSHLEARRGGEKRSAPGDDIVNQQYLLNGQYRALHGK